MAIHKLKTLPDFFDVVLSGEKTFELRKGDRDFKAGDVLLLREWSIHTGYTGREVRKIVPYLLTGPWLKPGYVCMSIKDI